MFQVDLEASVSSILNSNVYQSSINILVWGGERGCNGKLSSKSPVLLRSVFYQKGVCIILYFLQYYFL